MRQQRSHACSLAGRLVGNVALITGGDSGIGRGDALAFAREGADVVVSYLDEHVDAQETVDAVERSNRRRIAIAGDVGDESDCRSLIERTLEEPRPAGRTRQQRRVPDGARWDRGHPVRRDRARLPHEHPRALLLCTAAVPHLRPGSAIVNTTSTQTYQPSPGLLHYAATKGAITTFTKGLAQELAERAIRVNAVAPGPVWTPLIAISFPAEKMASFGEDNPLGRPASPPTSPRLTSCSRATIRGSCPERFSASRVESLSPD